MTRPTANGPLVAIDVDGTLIGSSLEISPQDRRAIAAAVQAGFRITLASGRLFAASRPYAVELGLDGPIIALQGAVAYDLRAGTRLFCTPLPAALALEAYDDLKARGFHLQLYYGDDLYLDADNEAARYYLHISRVKPLMVADLRTLLTAGPPPEPGPIKLLAVAQAGEVESTIPMLGLKLGGRANVFRSLPRFLEVTHPDANKGFALRRVAGILGVDMADTAAIGDSDNDVLMFDAAARSFAVANATPAARRAASQHVGPCGRGVAQALRILMEETAREPA